MAEMTEEDVKNMTPEQIAELQRQNCIFCKIASGDIPGKKVYEDENFIGVLDINPATQGHVLLMPKKHFQILPQLGNDLTMKLGLACKNVSAKLLKAFKPGGTTILIANGYAAGQKAPHLIIHIIPRNENDGLELNPARKPLEQKDYDDAKMRISESLGIRRPGSPIGKTSEKIEKEQEKKKDDVKAEKERAVKPKKAKPSKNDTEKAKSKPDIDLISRMFTQ